MADISKKSLIAVRPYNAEMDKSFIFATWLRGLYYGDSWFRTVPKPIFMHYYHKVLEHILATPGVYVQVACLKEDPEVILGYSVLARNGELLHWVFCKSAWRNIGIAKSLVPDNVSTVTHLTKVGHMMLNKRPQLVFNPFVVT